LSKEREGLKENWKELGSNSNVHFAKRQCFGSFTFLLNPNGFRQLTIQLWFWWQSSTFVGILPWVNFYADLRLLLVDLHFYFIPIQWTLNSSYTWAKCAICKYL
jgi:hypothetical protein